MTENTTATNPLENLQNPSVDLIRIDRMYESLRYNDYSTLNGLGEIVDNSVEASAANIEVKMKIEKVRKPGKKKATDEITEIAVIDDGCGMDQDTLHKCLALGESIRTLRDGKASIGRFGVGMTLGGISLARKIEVYSRTKGIEPFLYTYIDLDDIRLGDLTHIPLPDQKDPPENYSELLEGSSGTIVILQKCDRIEGDMEGFSNYLGRTYRKFIERGLKIFLNGEPVYLHDPLYMSGPTMFDVQKLKSEGVPDLKATSLGEERISLDIPGRNGEKADVVVRMSLLPREWRSESGDGGSIEARKRKIDQNEGVSILRADREVLYAHVPYITGQKGEARALDIDRWWGCEISFPPELDDYFQVRYIKRGAEPVASLRDQIREIIKRTVKTARTMIRQDRAFKRTSEDSNAGAFGKAEAVMAKAESYLPNSKKGKNLSESEDEKRIDSLASAALGAEKDNLDKKEQKKAEIRQKPYSIEPVDYPKSFLFEPVHMLNKTAIKLNVNHPFYKDVLQPLCGNLTDNTPGNAIVRQQQQDIKNAILLLLFSYAKAEAMFENHEDLFENLRSQWGTALSTVLSQYDREADLK